MLDAVAHAKEVRDRLRNPVNGRQSSELEIVPSYRMGRAPVRPAVPLRLAPQLSAQASRQERESAFNEEYDEHHLSSTMTTIIRVVRRYYGLTHGNIMMKRRTHSLVRPRQVIMYLAKKHAKLSFPQIGIRLGRMDHTTVMHGARKIEQLMKGDIRLAAEVENFERDLRSWQCNEVTA